MILFLAALLISGYCDALTCNQTALPTLYRGLWLDGDPITYNDVLITYPSNCTQPNLLERSTVCDYSLVLGDGAIIPSPPDLNSASYFRHFISWNRDSLNSFIDFDLTTATAGITAIELSFLNSPANRISSPEPRLSVVEYNRGFRDRNETNITTWIFDNQDLTQTDNQIRTISIQPLTPLSAANLRIRFQFTMFHEFYWIFLSEIRFCTQPQPPFQLQAVIFQTPLSIVVQPSADDLRRGSTELVCTISSEGLYVWQWKRDNTFIMMYNNGDYRITIGDGSRTTKLRINNLDFSDAANYECIATTTHDVDLRNSTVYLVEFPEHVVSTSGVCGYQTGEVTLTCELHGYQSSLSPPVWFDLGSSEITTTTKYTITSCSGGNTIVFEDGTAIPSVIVSLTIHNLSSADGGNYTCRGVRGGESVTQLVIAEGTAPPTTPPPLTTALPVTTQGMLATNNVLLPTMHGLVSTVIILVIALLLLIVFIVYLLRKKINKILHSLIRSTEAVQVPNSLSIQEMEDTSISVQDVTYEEIAERNVMSLTNNEAYVCVSTPLEK